MSPRDGFFRSGPIRWLYIGAVGLSATILLLSRGDEIHLLPVVFLAVMALVAELLPVPISRYSLRITLTLPFLTGMAVAVGPGGALVTDMAVTIVASWLLATRAKSKIDWTWLSVNVSISAISCSVAAVVGELAWLLDSDLRFAMVWSAVAFTVGYSITNFLLVSYFRILATGRKIGENLVQSLQIGISGLAVYTLFAVAISVLVFERQYWYLPVTMLPVLALRTGLQMKARMYEQYYETIVALSLMLQRAHPYSHGHLERVAKIAEKVGLRLGLSSSRARLVRQAAVLHDIGKIAIDEEILQKPGKLDADEMRHVRLHAEYGARILRQSPAFELLVPWVECHHERPDGTGYPHRLLDHEIPLESKIIAVVDAYDAMVGGDNPNDKRNYRPPMSSEEALIELQRCAGSQFDPRVVRAFREVLGHEVAA
ncbi:MAG: hypothetical protein HONBIEJF_02740 [Fimbriimonadaceae bacterium]|nr:hypothetical protein [Fimbriimonadaceae bacterium]